MLREGTSLHTPKQGKQPEPTTSPPCQKRRYKKARLITTLNCHRQCALCCNGQKGVKDAMIDAMLDDVLKENYEEYIITGGEPLLNWERTSTIIGKILEYSFNDEFARIPKIYLYTTICIPEMVDVIKEVDGIQYSLHHPYSAEDETMFKKFQNLISWFPDKKFRLFIDPDIETTIPIIPYAWLRVHSDPLMEECPVPDGELLFRIVEVW